MKKIAFLLFTLASLTCYSQEFGFTEKDIVINSDGNNNLAEKQYYVFNGSGELAKVQMKMRYAHHLEDMSIKQMNEALYQLQLYLIKFYNESNSLEIEKIQIKQKRGMLGEEPRTTYMYVGVDFFTLEDGKKKQLFHTYYLDIEGNVKKWYEWDYSNYDSPF